MKKSKFIILLVAFFLFLGLTSYIVYSFKHPSITKILESDSYSYLSNEAKEYVKTVYEETGEVVLTEKNKKENEPYLNPSFIEYLSASEEEKELMEIIPIAYAVDYEVLEPVEETLPTTFDLRNVGGNSYITPLKNQETMNLCWSFSTVEQVESNLMYTQGQPYSSSSLTFSTRQLDYAASTDGIKDYTNENGTRVLGDGGNFLTTSLLLSNGLGLIRDSKMPWNKSLDKLELQDVLNYDNSLYELNTSVYLPRITSETTASNKTTIINLVKQFVMNYGGVYVETEGPGYSCSSTNTDGSMIIQVDNYCTRNAGHAMHIIGWKDNYSYSYCKGSNKHTSPNGCSSTNLVTGTGAWIVRNSWGDSNSYVYLGYDSLDDNFYSFVNLTPMANRTWDNNYHKNMDSFTIYSSTLDMQTFTKKVDTVEKLEKIKFFSYGQNGSYEITIVSGDNEYETDSFTIPFPGYNTINLSSSNILLDGSSFEVHIYSPNGVKLLKNSMEVFTSNVDETPVIQAKQKAFTFNKATSAYKFRLYADTKNIPSNQNVQYSLWRGSTNVSSYLTKEFTKVAENNVNPVMTISSSIPEGFYTLKETYGGTTEEVTVKIGDTKVYYYANDGTNVSTVQVVTPNTPFTLNEVMFLRPGYNFIGWNTNSNGSGTSYPDKAPISGIVEALSLYAQWSPITYNVHFDKNGGISSMDDQSFTYDVSKKLSKNTFTKTGYRFTGWNTNSNGSGLSYTDEQMVSNLTSVDNATITLYAQWSPITYNVRFLPNGGSGTMPNQTFTYNVAQNLNSGIFYRIGYTFTGWNTMSDGSGTSYTNNQSIKNLSSTLNDTITLFAQWSPYSYTVQFDKNGGTGSMNSMSFVYDEEKALRTNTFTREDYIFTGWNTNSNGSGTSYTDEQVVSNLVNTNNGIITLYAQWRVDLPYTINHYSVDYENKYIDRVEVGTNLATYQNYFELGTNYSMTIDLGDKTILFTGSITKIFENDVLKDQFTNIVRGDINGDGKLSSLDYVKIKNHIMGTNVISDDILKVAADANSDNKISSLDYVRIKNYIMGGN